jgi:hypothetical protein
VLDHSLAFTNTLALPYAIGKELKQIDRPFFDRIKTLDKATVQRAIGDLVNADALEALFVRRDIIVKAFEKLAEQEGENKISTLQPSSLRFRLWVWNRSLFNQWRYRAPLLFGGN